MIVMYIAVTSFAGYPDEYTPGCYYRIDSCGHDKSLTTGKARIGGTVYRNPGGTPEKGVTIWQYDRILATSDADGKFVVLVSVEESVWFLSADSLETEIPALVLGERSTCRLSVFVGHEPLIMRKPVIYLYSETEKNVDVSIRPRGELTFCYPGPSSAWQVTTSSSGWITDQKTGKGYPYLFWEGENRGLFYTLKNTTEKFEGFIVARDSIVPFLEASLCKLGFNEIEKTDFITYWGPAMSQHEFCLVQFLFNRDYEQSIAALSVDPQPDSMLRTFMLFSGLTDPHVGFEVVPQSLPTFGRQGFSLVEWGGSEIKFFSAEH